MNGKADVFELGAHYEIPHWLLIIGLIYLTLSESNDLAAVIPEAVIPEVEGISPLIHHVRGLRVMLDADLAVMYGVETHVLRESVEKDAKRFPAEFMFALTALEVDSLVPPVKPSTSYANGEFPMAFTEQGVTMLSGILGSEHAIEVNISIMRTFVQMRTWMSAHREVDAKLSELETSQGENFKAGLDPMKLPTTEESKPRHPMGFQIPGME